MVVTPPKKELLKSSTHTGAQCLFALGSKKYKKRLQPVEVAAVFVLSSDQHPGKEHDQQNRRIDQVSYRFGRCARLAVVQMHRKAAHGRGQEEGRKESAQSGRHSDKAPEIGPPAHKPHHPGQNHHRRTVGNGQQLRPENCGNGNCRFDQPVSPALSRKMLIK